MKYICRNLCFSEKLSSPFKGHSNHILRVLLYTRYNWSISRAIQANYEWFTASWRAIGNCPAVQFKYRVHIQNECNCREMWRGRIEERVIKCVFFCQVQSSTTFLCLSFCHPDSIWAYFICIKMLYAVCVSIYLVFPRKPILKTKQYPMQHNAWMKYNCAVVWEKKTTTTKQY